MGKTSRYPMSTTLARTKEPGTSSCTMRSKLLPPELRDLVIDMLADDELSLRACSLVHSSWLARARHHLFHRVCINPASRGGAFKHLLESNPGLGQHVRELEIAGTAFTQASPIGIRWPTLHQYNPDRDSRHTPTPDSWLERVLPCPVEALSQVTCLKLTNLSISKELADVLGQYFSDTVTTLILDVCRATTFKDFCELPRALRRTECLHLLDFHWLRALAPAPEDHGMPLPSLKTLILTGKTDSPTVVHSIIADHRYARLSTLSCDIVGHPSATAIRKLLVAVGPDLRHLAIGFSLARDATEILNSAGLNLEPCTGLQRLDVHCSHDSRSPSLSWVLLLLSKLASPRLRELSFFIPAATLGALNLEVLMVVLSHARYTSLQRLLFLIRGQACSQVETRLRSKLCDLIAKGITLHVEFQPVSASMCQRYEGSPSW